MYQSHSHIGYECILYSKLKLKPCYLFEMYLLHVVFSVLLVFLTLKQSTSTYIDAHQFGKRYFISNDNRNHSASEAACKDQDLDLLRIDSVEEFAYIQQLFRINALPIWIGVNALRSADGKWFWQNNGDRVSTLTTANGEPLFVRGENNCNGCCRLAIREWPKGWWDEECKEEIMYICTKNITKIPGEISRVKRINRGRRYFLTKTKLTRSAAETDCKANGGRLAVINSELDIAEIRDIVENRKVWIGLAEAEENNIEKWKWHGEFDVKFAKWNSEVTRMYSRGVSTGVYLDSDDTWRIGDGQREMYGICEQKSWLEGDYEELKNQFSDLKRNVAQIGEKLSNLNRCMINELSLN